MDKSEVFFCRVLTLVIGIALGGLYTGYQLGVMNVAYKPLAKSCKWTKDETDFYHGLVLSFYQLGAAFTCPFVGYTTDKIGRINSILIGELFGIIGCILCTIFDIHYILVGRIVSGMAGAIFSVCVPLYIREITPKEMSGLLCTTYSFFLRLASAMSFSFVFGFSETQNNDFYLRGVLLFPIIALFLQFLIVKLLFGLESPRRLYAIKNSNKCQENLSYIYRNNARVLKELEIVKKNVEVATKSNEITFQEVLSKKLILGLIVMIFIHFFQQCSLGPTFLMYSTTVFESANINKSLCNIATLFIGLVAVDGVFCSSIIIDYVGRRIQLIGGSIFITILLFLFSFLTYYNLKLLQIICILILEMSYSLSFGSVTWVYQSEILYSKAQGISSIFHWVSQFAITMLFPLMLNNPSLSEGKLFLIFGSILFLSMFFCIFVVKETMNKNELENRFLYVIRSN